MEIKEIHAEDLTEDVLDLLTEAFKHPQISLDEARKRMVERECSNVHTFVIYLDGKTIGTASVILETKLFGELSKIAHLEDVCVHNQYRGYGYGLALVQHIIDYCKKNECRKIVLYCTNYNLAFYRKVGFRNTCNLMRLDLE